MANDAHLALLNQGVQTWNQWRRAHPEIRPDLNGVNISQVSLRGIDFSSTDLNFTVWTDVDLSQTDLTNAHLRQGTFQQVNLVGADLTWAALHHAELSQVNFSQARLIHGSLNYGYVHDSDLNEADLSDSYLVGTVFVRSSLRQTNLTGCHVYDRSAYDGVALWKVDLTDAIQVEALQLPDEYQPWLDPALLAPAVAVEGDDLARFLMAMLQIERQRHLRDEVGPHECSYQLRGTSLVLILGCFAHERSAVLTTLCSSVRARGYEPVMCDGASLALDSTAGTHAYYQGISLVRNLAHLANFTLVDLTGFSALNEAAEEQEFEDFLPWYRETKNEGMLLPLELIVHDCDAPFQFLLHEASREEMPRMDFEDYPQVLPCLYYQAPLHLSQFLQEQGMDAIETAIAKGYPPK